MGEATVLRLDNWGIRKVVDTPPGVEILSVSSNRLKALGAITACISLLELNLSGNRFEEVALLPLAQFRSLRTLNISNNRIRGLGRLFQSIAPAQGGRVEQFSALEELNVSENGALAEVAPAFTLRKLKKLQATGIAAVCLSCPHPGSKLEVLEMDRCSLAIVDQLDALSMLRTLVLDGNALLSGSGVLETSHPRLQTLRLCSNAIHAFPPLDLPCLTTLDLSSNQLVQLPPFTGAQNITSLSLSGNSLVSLASLAPLRFLTFLDVSRNALPGLDPSLARGVLLTLQVLNMSSNRVEHLEDLLSVLNTVHSLALEDLDLRNNPFTFVFYPESAYSLPQWSWDADETLDSLNRSSGIALLDADTQLELETYRSLIARTCRSLRSLDGLLIAERTERVRPIEKASQVSPMVRVATAAVQSDVANAHRQFEDGVFSPRRGLEAQHLVHQNARESDEVLYSTPRMSSESQQYGMPPWPSVATDLSIQSDSHDRQLLLSALQESDFARRGTSGSVVLHSPPVEQMSARRRERSESRASQQSDNVIRQRSTTTSPISRLSFDELPIVETDAVQSQLPDIHAPALLPSLSLHKRDTDVSSCVGNFDLERRRLSTSSTARELAGISRSFSMSSPRSALRSTSERHDTDLGSVGFEGDLEGRKTSTTSSVYGSPPRSALRSVSERHDADLGRGAVESDLERRRMSTTSTIHASPRSALRSVSERPDADAGSIGFDSVVLERRRTTTSSTICGSTPRSAPRSVPERCNTDVGSAGFWSVDLERRRVSTSSTVRHFPSTSMPMMSPTPPTRQTKASDGAGFASVDLEQRRISSNSIIRNAPSLGRSDSFGETHSRSVVNSASLPSQHSFILERTCPPTRDSLRDRMITPVAALHFQTPLQSERSSFRRHEESPADPANAEALPRPRGSIMIGVGTEIANTDAETPLPMGVNSSDSERCKMNAPPPQPSRTAQEHLQECMLSADGAIPQSARIGVNSARKRMSPVEVPSQLCTTILAPPTDNSVPPIDNSVTRQNVEHVSGPFASRNAYLKFLENEIASQRAFLKMRRDTPRHFSSAAQPLPSTARLTSRSMLPTTMEAMQKKEGFTEESVRRPRFERPTFPDIWRREEEDSLPSQSERFSFHNGPRRPKQQRAGTSSVKSQIHKSQVQKKTPDLCWEADSDSDSVVEFDIAQHRNSARMSPRKAQVEKKRDPSVASYISETDSSVRSCSLSDTENHPISWQASVKSPRTRSRDRVTAKAIPASGEPVQGVVTGPLFFSNESTNPSSSKRPTRSMAENPVIAGPLFFNMGTKTPGNSKRPTGSMAEFSQALAELQEFSSRTPAVPSELLRDVKITETAGPEIADKCAVRDRGCVPLAHGDGANLVCKDKEWHAVVTPVKHGERQLLEELIGQQTWAVPGRPVIYRYILSRAVQTEMPATQSAFHTLMQRDAARTDTNAPYGGQQQRAFFCGDAQRLAEVIASPFGFSAIYEGMVLLFAFDLRHAEALSASCDWSSCDCGASEAPKFGGRTLVAELALGNCHTADVPLHDALKSTPKGRSCGAIPMGPVFEAAYRSGADSLYFPQPGIFAILDPTRALPQFLVEYHRNRSNMSSLLCAGGDSRIGSARKQSLFA